MRALPTAYLLETQLVYASIYDLSVIVFGSEGLARLSTGDDLDEFDKLRIRHEITLATKLLIEIAVIVRNLLDGGNWPLDPIQEHRIDRRPEIDVGVVRGPDSSESNLNFREACNKIIHSQQVSFGMKSYSDNLKFLDGTVELEGTKGSRSWIAKIRIADFIRMAVRQL